MNIEDKPTAKAFLFDEGLQEGASVEIHGISI